VKSRKFTAKVWRNRCGWQSCTPALAPSRTSSLSSASRFNGSPSLPRNSGALTGSSLRSVVRYRHSVFAVRVEIGSAQLLAKRALAQHQDTLAE
jgi:hypothetical protein